ncbi:hypothetical protein [Haloarcula marina]|uniref:hypothetical protein n=1 Tax=Haloarcula marina TaxID=2961574 RepID=UPI0020B6BAF6|nr:hypothetical protein [Halomicroarcula marina]
MDRYNPVVNDGMLLLETEDDSLKVGTIPNIIDSIGGPKYTITYEKRQQTVAWLDSDSDGKFTIDVVEAVTTMGHRSDAIDDLREYDMSTEKFGIPERTVEFAELFVDILEQQGEQSG